MIRTARLAPWMVAVGLLSLRSTQAQITVSGVDDEEVYADSITLRVASDPGFDYTVTLDDEPVPTDTDIVVDRPQYHELLVQRRAISGGAVESELVKFIVRASERGNSEWGLPPFVPLPPVPSAPAEFAGATLRLVTPSAFPGGLRIPVIAWLVDADGDRVGVNGKVTATGFPDFGLQLLRGVGSSFLPPATPGTMETTLGIHGLQISRTIAVEETTPWSEVSGALAADANWGEDARVRLIGDATVPAGGTLTVGAGSVVVVGPGVSLEVEGTLRIEGSLERPVVFTPQSPEAHWGGFLFRTAQATAVVDGCIFTGSGANANWFSETSGSGSSHRKEEALFYLSNGATATLTDSYIIDNAGQAGHGEDSFLDMTRCLVQRCITTGQFNRGAVTLNDCALVEFPAFDAPFEDEDNDGFYLTGGAHSLTDCLIGWALDDGVDAGSGSAGSVDVRGCWFEACYHEGMAWSEDRLPTVRDTVAINCGQGLECGFGSPEVDAARVLSTANLVGARFGDNYDWDYNGFLDVTDSLLLYNWRDVWGRNWDDWTVRLAQMDVSGNHLSAPDPLHPDNTVWDPATDAPLLLPYMQVPAGPVGIGIAAWDERPDMSDLLEGLPVGLSHFTTQPVSVDYRVYTPVEDLGQGTLVFPAGDTVETLSLADLGLEEESAVRVAIENPVHGVITGLSEVTVVAPVPPVTLIPAGSVWKYRDDGVDLGTAWRQPMYDDDSWAEGPAELGYGDGDEATEINGGPDDARIPTVYFRRAFDVRSPGQFESLTVRLRRDDGGVVYINGSEVFRSNMEAGTITYSSWSDGTTDSETTFYPKDFPPEVLVEGVNVIAVEIHQANDTSSDVSFDLELLGQLPPPTFGVPRFLRGDANGDAALDISDALGALFFLFGRGAAGCEDALDVDDNGLLEITDPILLLEYLYLHGPAPAAPFPRPGDDPTADTVGCERF